MRLTAVLALSAVLVLGACGGGDNDAPATSTATELGDEFDNDVTTSEFAIVPSSEQPADPTVMWEFDGTLWNAIGEVPECPEPLTLITPANISLATSALYPGQERGGDYKGHGGLRFDGQANDAIEVRAPMTAVLWRGSRYIEQGEVQYMLDFVAPCGIMYRLDHLLTLTPEFSLYTESLPEPQPDVSVTSPLEQFQILAGTPIATAVGFTSTGNVSFDLGVYDLRDIRPIADDPDWYAMVNHELAPFGLCWFDLLPADQASAVRALPPGDAESGPDSNYC